MLSILRWQETLDLSHNNFTHFSCNMELVWASSLKRLNLSYNKLGTISWNICQLTCLQDLDVSHNCLRRLPNEEFWTCTTLHKLNLSHNKVSSPCSKRVKSWVRNATSKLLGIVWRDSIKANKHDVLQVCFYLSLWTIPRAFAFISRTRCPRLTIVSLRGDWVDVMWNCIMGLFRGTKFWASFLRNVVVARESSPRQKKERKGARELKA